MGEIRNYKEIFLRYWPLVLSLGLFFGWLHSFPVQGQLLNLLTDIHDYAPLPLIAGFYIGHFIGLGAAGLTGYFWRQALPWFFLGAIPCTILSFFLALGIPTSYWILIFTMIGLFSGMSVISWGNSFAAMVHPERRGRTFISGAALAYLISDAITLISQSVHLDLLILISSLLPLAMPVLMLFWYKCKTTPLQNSNTEALSEKKTKFNQCLTFLPFIFTIAATGGLTYTIIGNVVTVPTGLLGNLGMIPYIILLFIAGSLADFKGRRIIAIAGAIVVGIGFTSAGFMRGDVSYLVIQTLAIGGYAFLDTFIWVIAADISDQRIFSLNYFIILGTNILAVLIGVLLGQKISELASGKELLTISAAGLLCFISLAFVFKMKETLKFKPSAAPQTTQNSYAELSQKAGFTTRELDIVKLLIAGDNTKEILNKLSIAPDTLKSHLHNIYLKAGVRNRMGLVLVIMKTTKYTEKIIEDE